MKISKLFIKALYKLAHKLEGSDSKSSKESMCLIQGQDCHFTSNVKIFNHSNNPNLIQLNDGVFIDGALEVYEKGKLIIDSYTFFGNSRIYCANSILIGKGCWIADHVFIMDSNLHPISPSQRFQDAINFSKGIFPDVYSNILNSPVIIQDSVWIGANSVVLKGITIGDRPNL